MQLAYLILAFHQPELLARFIKRLAGPESHFFIHVDKKSNIRPFQKALKPIRANIHFSQKRINVFWGHWTLAKAILNLAKEASDYARFNYYTYKCGATYPIKSREFILNFYGNSSCEYLASVEANEKMHIRAETFIQLQMQAFVHWVPNKKFIPLRPLALKIAEKAKKKFLEPIERKIPFGDSMPYGLYQGNPFWSLTHPAVKYLLDQINHFPEYERHFRYGFAPDLILPHTILNNSPFREKTSRLNLTLFPKIKNKPENYDRFHRIASEDHWNDIKHISQNNPSRLFLRKMNLQHPSSVRLLNLIDKEIFGAPDE